MNNADLESAIKMAKESGFQEASILDASTIELLDDVRNMCAANTCGMYGKNWACPPACGSLEECREKVSHYHYGILVQTVGEIEDSMDFEGMMEAEAAHKAAFLKTADLLREKYPNLLPLGSGTCTICKKCAYPDAPCRFPDRRISSMEAYGVLVSEVCKRNQMKYYYGSDHITYTACYLLY